jgi:leader peptidase (prepilin peptidase)/N-methyltransferase
MIILVIILGLAVGSFLNVCIYRIQRNQSIIKPRSKCPVCDHRLKNWENIPILSYLFLRGKCSNCNTRISLRYPLVELLTSIVFLLLYYTFGYTVETFLFCILLCIVIIITFIDIDVQLIPNKLLVLCLVPTTIYIMLTGFNNIWIHLIGAIGLSGGFLLVGYLGKLIYKEDSMGMGDVKYAFVIGLLLGWKNGLLAVGIVLFLFIFKKLTPRQRIPFGPFMSIGLLVALVCGNKIINWYFHFYN